AGCTCAVRAVSQAPAATVAPAAQPPRNSTRPMKYQIGRVGRTPLLWHIGSPAVGHRPRTVVDGFIVHRRPDGWVRGLPPGLRRDQNAASGRSITSRSTLSAIAFSAASRGSTFLA